MNSNQKQRLGLWEKTTRFTMKDGGKMCISNIIADVRAKCRLTDEELPEYRSNVHPWLYYNYVIDWSKIPQHKLPKSYKTGKEFGREVIDKWQEVCYKDKFFKYGNLNVYDTVNQLRDNDSKLLGDDITLGKDYLHHEERLYEIRQEQLDLEEMRHRREQERLQIERDRALAENNAKEANRKLEEAVRKEKAYNAQLQARANKQFYEQQNSPWKSSVVEDGANANHNVNLNANDNDNDNANDNVNLNDNSNDNVNANANSKKTTDNSQSNNTSTMPPSLPVSPALTAATFEQQLRAIVTSAAEFGISRRISVEYLGGDDFAVNLISGSGKDATIDTLTGHSVAEALDHAIDHNNTEITIIREEEAKRKAAEEEEKKRREANAKKKQELMLQFEQFMAAAMQIKKQIDESE